LIWPSAVACFAASAVTAEAAPKFPFSLPRQALPQSLETVGTVTRSNIIFTPRAAKGRIAPPLKGNYSVAEALRRLLKDTGLAFSVTAGGSYVISQRADISGGEEGPVDTPASTELYEAAPIIVTGSRIARKDYTSNSPIVSIGAEQLKATNSVTMDDVLFRLPEVTPAFGQGSNDTTTSGVPIMSSQKIGPCSRAIRIRSWIGAPPSTVSMLPSSGVRGGWGIGCSLFRAMRRRSSLS